MRLEPSAAERDGRGDEELVAGILATGSEEAFRVLYRRHSPRIYHVLLRMLASDADAEDALQETWLRCSTQLGTFAWRSALSTWLTSIAVNIARNMLERRGRWAETELVDDVLPESGEAIGEPLDFERALAVLPPGCRAAFVLHDIEGYTHEEIAEMLGYTDGTSKSQVFRARRTLRRLLSGVQEEESRNAS
jgi:RNA polymerase sigma-70 factor (ECF subfamily)